MYAHNPNKQETKLKMQRKDAIDFEVQAIAKTATIDDFYDSSFENSETSEEIKEFMTKFDIINKFVKNNAKKYLDDDKAQQLINFTEEQLMKVQELCEKNPYITIDYILNLSVISGIICLVALNVVTVDMDHWDKWSLAKILARIPKDNWDNYMMALEQTPIQVKALTSGTVYVIGDILSQLIGKTSLGELDRVRTLRSGMAGLLLHGPLSHQWYIISDNLFEYLKITDWWSVFPKVAVDQLFWGPIWNGTYVTFIGLLQSKKIQEVFEEVKSTCVPLMTSGFKLWIPTHLVTYGLIPQENRLLWVDTVEILWCIILATKAAEASKKSA